MTKSSFSSDGIACKNVIQLRFSGSLFPRKQAQLAITSGGPKTTWRPTKPEVVTAQVV
jgi:hypothetical protein